MTSSHKHSHSKRITIVGVGVVLLGVLLGIQLFSIQIVRGEEFEDLADRSYVDSNDRFDRGSIFLTSKDGIPIAGATLVKGYLLAINPSKIVNKEDAFTALSPHLTRASQEDFFRKADKQDDPYEEIERKIPRERADAIRSLAIPGVSLYEDSWRYYPGEGLLSSVLGFVAYKGDELHGQYGLERMYDDVLVRGKDEGQINTFAEIFTNIGSTFFKRDTEEGDIITTIETRVQQYLEQTLESTLARWNADSGFGVIINPNTGEIYAMASNPSYNNNEFNTVSDIAIYRNPVIEDIYEFGSVIKPLVVAGALDAGAVTSETEYYDPGFVQVEDATIKNFDEKGRGQVTVRDILAESLNTGMVFIMEQMGRDKLRSYLTAFGLGERTGIDLPSEVKGMIKNLESPRKLEYATASFGQGISMSPIALVRALSALGNGGYLIQPHIVKTIEYSNGENKEIVYPKENQPRVIDEGASREITRILVSIVDETLGEGSYAEAGYTVAAKTGTAQIPHPQGGYYEDRHRHSFFGYFPAYDPQFLILLSINHPKGVKYASQTLSEPFFDISDFIIRYYNLPPDR